MALASRITRFPSPPAPSEKFVDDNRFRALLPPAEWGRLPVATWRRFARTISKRLFETAWSPTDEIVPGYPLEPKFDPQAYADRFSAKVRRIGDAAHGLHPCERWELSLPSGDAVVVWAARDLERLAVKIEQMKKDQSDEYQPFTTTELLDVRVGADPKLFEKPEGYQVVKSFQELTAGAAKAPGSS